MFGDGVAPPINFPPIIPGDPVAGTNYDGDPVTDQGRTFVTTMVQLLNNGLKVFSEDEIKGEDSLLQFDSGSWPGLDNTPAQAVYNFIAWVGKERGRSLPGWDSRLARLDLDFDGDLTDPFFDPSVNANLPYEIYTAITAAAPMFDTALADREETIMAVLRELGYLDLRGVVTDLYAQQPTKLVKLPGDLAGVFLSETERTKAVNWKTLNNTARAKVDRWNELGPISVSVPGLGAKTISQWWNNYFNQNITYTDEISRATVTVNWREAIWQWENAYNHNNSHVQWWKDGYAAATGAALESKNKIKQWEVYDSKYDVYRWNQLKDAQYSDNLYGWRFVRDGANERNALSGNGNIQNWNSMSTSYRDHVNRWEEDSNFRANVNTFEGRGQAYQDRVDAWLTATSEHFRNNVISFRGGSADYQEAINDWLSAHNDTLRDAVANWWQQTGAFRYVIGAYIQAGEPVPDITSGPWKTFYNSLPAEYRAEARNYANSWRADSNNYYKNMVRILYDSSISPEYRDSVTIFQVNNSAQYRGDVKSWFRDYGAGFRADVGSFLGEAGQFRSDVSDWLRTYRTDVNDWRHNRTDQYRADVRRYRYLWSFQILSDYNTFRPENNSWVGYWDSHYNDSDIAAWRGSPHRADVKEWWRQRAYTPISNYVNFFADETARENMYQFAVLDRDPDVAALNGLDAYLAAHPKVMNWINKNWDLNDALLTGDEMAGIKNAFTAAVAGRSAGPAVYFDGTLGEIRNSLSSTESFWDLLNPAGNNAGGLSDKRAYAVFMGLVESARRWKLGLKMAGINPLTANSEFSLHDFLEGWGFTNGGWTNVLILGEYLRTRTDVAARFNDIFNNILPNDQVLAKAAGYYSGLVSGVTSPGLTAFNNARGQFNALLKQYGQLQGGKTVTNDLRPALNGISDALSALMGAYLSRADNLDLLSGNFTGGMLVLQDRIDRFEALRAAITNSTPNSANFLTLKNLVNNELEPILALVSGEFAGQLSGAAMIAGLYNEAKESLSTVKFSLAELTGKYQQIWGGIISYVISLTAFNMLTRSMNRSRQNRYQERKEEVRQNKISEAKAHAKQGAKHNGNRRKINLSLPPKGGKDFDGKKFVEGFIKAQIQNKMMKDIKKHGEKMKKTMKGEDRDS